MTVTTTSYLPHRLRNIFVDFPSESLFTTAAYLEPLEQPGCADAAAGWLPQHLVLPQGRAPVYLKTHSWGEFVFDFAIARAYEQHGLPYYPKLVSCVPFTPVPGPRLLAADDAGRRVLAQALMEQARAQHCSSAHVLYLPEDEAALLVPLGWLRRVQPRYLWRNAGYAEFEDFLGALNAKQRKNLRRERRLVQDSGLAIEWRTAAEVTEKEWPLLHALYASTYHARGQPPYLTPACLRQWGRNFGSRMLFCMAREQGELSAMAFFFRDGDALYGRHWGARAHYDSLHFELCYYRGIEYCIEHRLALFDAGVQGEHKLTRGFVTEAAHSAHWFAHSAFRAPVARWFEEERRVLSGG